MKNKNKKHCKRCEYNWPSKKDNPVQCPRCKSPYWNRDRLKRRSWGDK